VASQWNSRLETICD